MLYLQILAATLTLNNFGLLLKARELIIVVWLSSTMTVDSNMKSNILNEYFASVFTVEDVKNIPDMRESPYISMSDITVTLIGVTNLLHDLKPHKACGPDQIPIRLLEETSTQIAPVLLLIFSVSLHQGKVPKEWKHAYVTPVFKNGDGKL